MPRTISLTWQPGSASRPGRWRKKYRGKLFYFDAGRGKSDRPAYDAAVRQWELEKVKFDAAAPRKHQREFEAEIDVWDQVLSWSNRHSDLEMAQLAFEKKKKLESGLEAPVLSPVSSEDRFGDLFKPTIIELPDTLIQQVADDLKAGEFKPTWPLPEMSLASRRAHAAQLDGSSFRIQREIWDDRLKSQQRRLAVRGNSVEEHIAEFLLFKESQVQQGELSIGRAYAIRLHLNHFQAWIGKDTSVVDIDGTALRDYHKKLLGMVKSGAKKLPRQKKGQSSWTSTTARHYLVTVKSFVRWLWEVEVIPALPRVLGHKSATLKIASETPTAVTFDVAEIRLLLEKSTDRTKLYMLLMLNCGMTQKDVADLRKNEIDFDAGRIIRKRSKTDKFESVPMVNYRLWPDTLRLLRHFIDGSDSPIALLNSNGSPLWSERLGDDGKYGKADNIKNAFDRLRKEQKITKSMKSFKKTSSSLLRDDERFNGLEDLFLGHAPQRMSDKHYTAAPQKLLDSAICWLAEQYGLDVPSA